MKCRHCNKTTQLWRVQKITVGTIDKPIFPPRYGRFVILCPEHYTKAENSLKPTMQLYAEEV